MSDTDFHKSLSREEVLESISRDLGTKDFNLVSYDLRQAGDNRMGFLGVHFKIYACVEINGTTKNVQYFVKKVPVEVPSHNYYAKATRIFFKEIFFYDRVVNDLKRNMTPGRKLSKWCPEMYFSRGEDIIVLEDISCDGYIMHPERSEFDMEHILATLRSFASMHSGFLILEEKVSLGIAAEPPSNWTIGKSPNLAEFYPEIMFETEASDDVRHPGNTFYEAGIKSEVALVDLLPGYTMEERAKIKQRLPDIMRKMFQYVKPSRKFRNVLTHGDIWSNNIMFKKGPTGNVQDAILIDFQLARYAPPAHDVIMFIHMVQNRQFRQEHLTTLVKYYYDALTMEISAEGLNIESILPLQSFLESCDYFYECSLIMQIFFYQLMLAPSRITEEFLTTPELFDLNMLVDRTEMVKETFQTDELSRNRMTEALNELIEHFKLYED